VKSDHNNLKYFRTARLFKPRHARWAEELSQFDFVIEHISGVSNVVADALSRSPTFSTTNQDSSEIILLKDKQFVEMNVIESATHDWPEDVAGFLMNQEWKCQEHEYAKFRRFIEKFKIMGAKLYYITPVGWPRAYVPANQRQEILARFHDNLGHLGAESILDLIVRRYYWPNLQSDLRQYVKSCANCQLARSRGGAPKPPLQPIPPVALPFERLGLDFLSNLPLSKSGNRHCITCVDYASRWVWAVPVRDMSSTTVIQFFYHHIICFIGCPSELITDRGANFMSQEFEEFLNIHRIKHLKTSPYHPATNGLVERMHSMINHGISALCQTRVNRWDDYVAEIVWGMRVRTHAVTKLSPFYVLFGLHPRLSGDFTPPNQLLAPLDEVEERLAVEGFTNRELEDLGVARGQAYLRTQAQK
jgi:hypothetical protein